MQSKSGLIKEKHIKWEKRPYNNHKKLFSNRKFVFFLELDKVRCVGKDKKLFSFGSKLLFQKIIESLLGRLNQLSLHMRNILILWLNSSHRTIGFIIFWDFSMFYQIFPLPQVKRCAIITYKHGIHELPHELPNGLRLRILGN